MAMAAAKGLVLALGLPLLAVPTLDTIAYPHQAQPWPVVALVQAGRIGDIRDAAAPAPASTP